MASIEQPHEGQPVDVAPQSPRQDATSAGALFAVSVVGLSVGLLVGMSASPVVGSVIGGLLAMITAALAILVGWKRPEWGAIQMTPLAWFTALLVLGGLGGVWIRTNSLLSPGVVAGMDKRSRQVEAWVALGIDREQVVQALFAKEFPLSPDVRALRIRDPAIELQKWASGVVSSTVVGDAFVQFVYPATGSAAGQNSGDPASPPPDITNSVFWSDRVSACDDLRNELDSQPTNEALARSILPRWQALAVIENVDILQTIISEDLCPLDQYQWPWESS